jgi:hypothetical protein
MARIAFARGWRGGYRGAENGGGPGFSAKKRKARRADDTDTVTGPERVLQRGWSPRIRTGKSDKIAHSPHMTRSTKPNAFTLPDHRVAWVTPMASSFVDRAVIGGYWHMTHSVSRTRRLRITLENLRV